jgi:DNA-directed RNA polymerase subunit alpha
MDLLLSYGQNFVLAGKADMVVPKDFITVDASFSPVLKANFFVEKSSEDPSATLENLILEVWTNGSLKPQDALLASATILRNTSKAILKAFSR